MGLFDGIGSFLTNNSDWIKPLVGAGLGAYKQSQVDTAQSSYLDYLRQREQQNYQDSVAQINAYNQLHAGQSSGGSAGNGAAVAAARANQAAAQAAAKKSNAYLQNTYKQLLAQYAPFAQTAQSLLPQMTQTYENSLGLQNALGQFINSPAQVAKLNASVPAYAINIPTGR